MPLKMNMEELEKIKKYLENELKDCLELEKKKALTEKGKGILIMLKSIFNHMGWKIEGAEDL